MKTERIPTNLVMHSAYHNETYNNSIGVSRRYISMTDGGFCEVGSNFFVY